jgi:hypothetical protein
LRFPKKLRAVHPTLPVKQSRRKHESPFPVPETQSIFRPHNKTSIRITNERR